MLVVCYVLLCVACCVWFVVGRVLCVGYCVMSVCVDCWLMCVVFCCSMAVFVHCYLCCVVCCVFVVYALFCSVMCVSLCGVVC